MPEMDGVEATAEIRKHGTGANIPIIACTGHAIESDTMVFISTIFMIDFYWFS